MDRVAGGACIHREATPGRGCRPEHQHPHGAHEYAFASAGGLGMPLRLSRHCLAPVLMRWETQELPPIVCVAVLLHSSHLWNPPVYPFAQDPSRHLVVASHPHLLQASIASRRVTASCDLCGRDGSAFACTRCDWDVCGACVDAAAGAGRRSVSDVFSCTPPHTQRLWSLVGSSRGWGTP